MNIGYPFVSGYLRGVAGTIFTSTVNGTRSVGKSEKKSVVKMNLCFVLVTYFTTWKMGKTLATRSELSSLASKKPIIQMIVTTLTKIWKKKKLKIFLCDKISINLHSEVFLTKWYDFHGGSGVLSWAKATPEFSREGGVFWATRGERGPFWLRGNAFLFPTCAPT